MYIPTYSYIYRIYKRFIEIYDKVEYIIIYSYNVIRYIKYALIIIL